LAIPGQQAAVERVDPSPKGIALLAEQAQDEARLLGQGVGLIRLLEERGHAAASITALPVGIDGNHRLGTCAGWRHARGSMGSPETRRLPR
jgi:hypothetical protein